MAFSSLRGKLLVATPVIGDPNFFRTVVLMLAHTEEGALGVVLNRPSDTGVEEALPAWGGLAAAPGVVFVGGPVAPGAAICLALAAPRPPGEGWERVLGPLGVLDLSLTPADVAPGVDRLRVFVGYAGWNAGQLEGEIEQGGWFVLDADQDDALSATPERLWRFVLRRQGGKLAWVANYPPHPSMN